MRANKNKKKLIIAVLAGIVVTYIVFSMISNQNKQISELQEKTEKKPPSPVVINTQQPRTLNIVTAAKPIKAGTKLTQDLLKLEQRSSDKIAPDSADNILALLNKQVSVDIAEGEVINKTTLTEEKARDLEIPNGMRAITIPTEFIQGLASYIKIGTRVDVVSTAKDKEDRPEILLQNVKVISFESNTDINNNSITANKASAITLQVPAEKATNIVNAISAGGKIQFIARNLNDNKYLASNKSSGHAHINNSNMKIPKLDIKALSLPPADNLFDNKTLPPPASPNIGARSQKVELIQANVKSEVKFDDLN